MTSTIPAPIGLIGSRENTITMIKSSPLAAALYDMASRLEKNTPKPAGWDAYLVSLMYAEQQLPARKWQSLFDMYLMRLNELASDTYGAGLVTILTTRIPLEVGTSAGNAIKAAGRISAEMRRILGIQERRTDIQLGLFEAMD